MEEETAESKSIIFKYPRDLWAYLQGPASFLEAQDLSSNASLKHATKTLMLGLSGVIAFSAFNLNFSSFAKSEQARKLFEGRVLEITLLMGCLINALLAHVVALILNGHGGWRQSYTSFALTFGFIWPSSALVMIVIAWLIQLSTGLPWVALPPFDPPNEGVLDRTTTNIVLAAVFVTLYIWVIGYLIYCYGCAIWAAHRLSSVRVGGVVSAIVALNVFDTTIPRFIYLTSEKLEPLIGWIIQLL